MNKSFEDILDGFIKAQTQAHQRGDFSANAGVDFLNKVNQELEAKLRPAPCNPATPGFGICHQHNED